MNTMKIWRVFITDTNALSFDDFVTKKQSSLKQHSGNYSRTREFTGFII